MSKTLKLTIDNPCTEDWNNMIPDASGRYCLSCQKSVVDFTQFTDEEIKDYFKERNYQPLCGRFTNKQLCRIRIELPEDILRTHIPFWKKFLVMILIAFGATLFSIETSFAQTDTVINQEIVAKKVFKTKNKHKSRHKKIKGISKAQIDFWEKHRSGFTVMRPLESPFNNYFPLPDLNYPLESLADSGSSFRYAPFKKSEEDEDDHQSIPAKNEALLASPIFRLNRRKRKKNNNA